MPVTKRVYNVTSSVLPLFALRIAIPVVVAVSLVGCRHFGVGSSGREAPQHVVASYLERSFNGRPPGSGLDCGPVTEQITHALANSLSELRHLYLDLRQSRRGLDSGLPLTLDIRYAGANFVCGLPNCGPLGGRLCLSEPDVKSDSATVPAQVILCINKEDTSFRGTVHLKRGADGWRVDDVKWDRARNTLREQLRLEHEWLLTQQRQLSSAVQ